MFCFFMGLQGVMLWQIVSSDGCLVYICCVMSWICEYYVEYFIVEEMVEVVVMSVLVFYCWFKGVIG